MDKVFIYNETLGLKGSSGVLYETNPLGYYDAVIKVKDKRHRVYLPISTTVMIFIDPIIEVDSAIEIE